MAITAGQGAPIPDGGGLTNLQKANQFVRVETAGARDLVKKFQELAGAASSPAILKKIVETAKEPIERGYRLRAKEHEATGNLAASVTHKTKNYENGAVAIVGPRQTGPIASTPQRRSGNHAWLVEFGSPPRRPGTNGRLKPINVHQMINGRMRYSGSLDDRKFRTAGPGLYFLMGSKNYRAGSGGRPGYSRDAFDSYGTREQHPISLKPGETIAGMPPLHIMEDTIAANSGKVLSILKNLLIQQINLRS